MDPPPPIKMRWLQNPQIIGVEVTQRHHVLLLLLLIKVECLKLRSLTLAWPGAYLAMIKLFRRLPRLQNRIDLLVQLLLHILQVTLVRFQCLVK